MDRTVCQELVQALRSGKLSLEEALHLHEALEADPEQSAIVVSQPLLQRLRAIPEEAVMLPTAFDELCLAEMDGETTPDMERTIAALCATYPGLARQRAALRSCRLEPPPSLEYARKTDLKRAITHRHTYIRMLGRVAAAVAIVALAGVRWIDLDRGDLDPYASPAEHLVTIEPARHAEPLGDSVSTPEPADLELLVNTEPVAAIAANTPVADGISAVAVVETFLPLLPYALPHVELPTAQSVALALVPVECNTIDWEAREMYDELAEVATYEEPTKGHHPVMRWLDRASLLVAALSN